LVEHFVFILWTYKKQGVLFKDITKIPKQLRSDEP